MNWCWLQREIKSEAIVRGETTAKRVLGLNTHINFEFGARNSGKGRCFKHFNL